MSLIDQIRLAIGAQGATENARRSLAAKRQAEENAADLAVRVNRAIVRFARKSNGAR